MQRKNVQFYKVQVSFAGPSALHTITMRSSLILIVACACSVVVAANAETCTKQTAPSSLRRPRSAQAVSSVLDVQDRSKSTVSRLRAGAAIGTTHGRLRNAIFPVFGKDELNKFFALGGIKFFIIFVLTLTRDLKDTLVVTSCGAESISFLKVRFVSIWCT
jgi:TLC ATP/ADP transporter